MSSAPPSMTVFIPLAMRKRNGRARIVPPAEMVAANEGGVDPHVLRAIARAWSWRRRLETSEASTILDIAQAEGVTDRYVSRMIRLAWLSPAVLEKLVLERCPPAVSIKELAAMADLTWCGQEETVFGERLVCASLSSTRMAVPNPETGHSFAALGNPQGVRRCDLAAICAAGGERQLSAGADARCFD